MSSLAKTTSLTSSTGKSSAFTVLVNGVDDPVDSGIVTDLLMGWVNHDNLIVFHSRILVDPVGVQDTQVGISASSLLLGNILEIALELQLSDTLVLGLTEDHTTVILSFTSSSADTSTDDDIPLLGLVTKAVGLVSTGGMVARQNVGTLTVFPSTNTTQESEGVRLLVAPDLFHILVSTHDCSGIRRNCHCRTKKRAR